MNEEEKQLFEENVDVSQQQQYIDDKFLNLSLEDKLKQVLSSNNDFVSVSKEEYQKIKQQKKQIVKKARIDDEYYYLLNNSKSRISRINNKLNILDKVIADIQREAQPLMTSKKVQQKILELEKIRANSRRFKKMFIFLDDIDINELQKQAEERFK